MAQKQWRVTLLALRTNQTVASNNTNSHCNLHHKTLLAGKKKKVPVSLKNILDKVVKKIVSQPLSTFICNILCDKMEVRIRCSTYTPKYDGYLEEEYLCDWVLGQISSFFFNGIPILLERTYSFLDLGIRQTFSWKLTKGVCHFKKNKWLYLLPMIKFGVSSEN